MSFPPIIERELRIALRKQGLLRMRFWLAAGAAAVVSFFLLLSLLTGDRSVGRTLHTLLFYCGLYLAIVPPAEISIGLFAQERGNQTLELLYLTGMNAGELFSGKLFGGLLVASSQLLALAPLLAIPFLCGGVSLDVFVATIACFPALLLFMTSAGVLASVICRDDGAALGVMITIVVVVALALPIPYYLGSQLAGIPPFPADWLCLSPAYGPYLVRGHFRSMPAGEFWKCMLSTLTWSALFLGIAAMLLRRNWRWEMERAATGRLTSWQAWIRGNGAERLDLRRRLLDRNPFQWFIQQDRRPQMMAWVFIGAIGLLWLACWCVWPHFWPNTLNFFTTALVLLIGTGWIVAYAAAHRIGTDRRNGGLELLLTTPLSPLQILEGQRAATKKLFKPVRRVLALLCLLLMAGGLVTRSWSIPGLITYCMIWLAFFIWAFHNSTSQVPRSMWIALNSGRPILAVMRLRGNMWTRLWWCYYIWMMSGHIFRFRSGASSFPSGDISETFWAGIVMFFVGIFYLANRSASDTMASRFVAEMRSIVREPAPEPNDPRLKQWKDVTHRLPPLPPAPFPVLPRAFDKQRTLR